MKVIDIMSRNVSVISADESLVDAASRMARKDIGFLPVINEKIIGVVTDRDIVVRAVAKGLNPSETKVGDIVSPDVAIVSESDDSEDVAKLMQNQKIRRVLVADQNGACVGVVSLGDLAAQGHECELSGKALEGVCET